METRHVFKITASSGQKTAIDLLEKAFMENQLPKSRQSIKQIMQKGCVWLENKDYVQRLRRAKKQLKEGDTLYCYYDEKVLNSVPLKAELMCDEGDYSIWNKPSGMLSQGSKWGDHCTINRWAEQNLTPERPAFIVHRLDRAASGLILIAHKKTVAEQLSKLFRERKIVKKYYVTVEGDFSQYLAESAIKEGKVVAITEDVDGKAAVSHVIFLEYDKHSVESSLSVQIETGRKHQIRKHLSGLGYPVVGDRLYGRDTKTDSKECKNLQLASVFLSFECPITDGVKKYAL